MERTEHNDDTPSGVTDQRKALCRLESNSSLDSTLNMPNLSDLVDVFDGINLCEEYDIPYDGLQDVDEFMERIQLHFVKKSRSESRKQRVSSILLFV